MFIPPQQWALRVNVLLILATSSRLLERREWKERVPDVVLCSLGVTGRRRCFRESVHWEGPKIMK